MVLTFNELSSQTTHLSSKTEAQNLIDEFAAFCKVLNATKIIDDIVFPSDFYSTFLYDEYGISQWLYDNDVPQTRKQFLRRYLDKYRNSFDRSCIEGEFLVSIDEKNHNAIGCTFALERNLPLFSLATHDFWKSKSISGNYVFLNHNGEVQSEQRSVDNISTIASEADIVQIQRDKVLKGISSGQDLWEAREKLYPNLVFCNSVKDQLYRDSEKFHILAVMKRLQHLQNYFSQYHEKYDADELGFDARTESETVKKSSDLSDKRKFRLPDGTEKYFYDHIGFSGKYSGGRIHFLPDCKNRSCYIGYIGQHLPTQKYQH